MDRLLPRLAAAVVALICLLPRGLAAQITPVGLAVRADTLSQYDPICPHLAVGPERSFEIAWEYGGLFSFNAAFGRHFSPSGEPSSGAQVQLLSSGPFNFAVVDRVAALPDGFQVFLRQGHTTQPPDNLLQPLDRNGDPVGPAELLRIKRQILVGPGGDLYTTFYLTGPQKLGTQRVAPDGSPQGPRIFLNSRPISDSTVTLAPFSDGEFVAGWNGFTVGARPRQVLRARLFHDGRPLGQDFDLNAIAAGTAGQPPRLSQLFLAMAPSTQGFAAVWVIQDAAADSSIHLRFFDASGRPRTPEIVAVPGAHGVELQSAALDGAGSLLLLWRPQLQTVLRARLFSAATGAPLGPVFPVARTATYTCGDLAWTGDSWLITYRANSDDGKGAIVWRRFTE